MKQSKLHRYTYAFFIVAGIGLGLRAIWSLVEADRPWWIWALVAGGICAIAEPWWRGRKAARPPERS